MMTSQIWPGLSWVFFERGAWLNPRMALRKGSHSLCPERYCVNYSARLTGSPLPSTLGPATKSQHGYLSAESWKMDDICLGHSLERIPRFAPRCQAAYDDKCLKSPFP
jgi:hypothetical protein